MRKFLIPLLLVLLASCSQVPPVKDRDVPTAFFVFFDENSAQAVDGSAKVLDEVAGFLKFYDDLTVNIIGQRAKSETSDAKDVRRQQGCERVDGERGWRRRIC
jgi:hypothetical protein